MRPIFQPKPLIRNVRLDTSSLDPKLRSRCGLYAEWILTNGLGGYASGTIGGLNTRRFHGWLIAALPAPHGRTMMVNHLRERFYSNGKEFRLDCEDVVPEHTPSVARTEDPVVPESDPVLLSLAEFRLEMGMPVWIYRMEEAVLEKRVTMVHRQNSTYLRYKLLEGKGRLEVQPALHVRPHDGSLEGPPHHNYRFGAAGAGFELWVSDDLPRLRFAWNGEAAGFRMDAAQFTNLRYRVEQSRGYDWRGNLWSPGVFSTELNTGSAASLALSTEGWEHVEALKADDAFAAEQERRRRMLQIAPGAAQEGVAAELVLAADQFLITPVGRTADQVRAFAVGDEVRSVIAGYHWFTDWGRDTMISLEGLTLCTGRWREAEYILRSFANYIHHGLIPNLFPEGKTSGLYHTADATLWLFHAVDRYMETTSDLQMLEFLLPKLIDIVHWHLRGTDFGIGVDPSDGLLRQGAVGYQLTWMDAKVDGWVVTPRRGKAVEINALWYNALRLCVAWMETMNFAKEDAQRFKEQAELAYQSFQRRFWNEKEGCLYDVVDSPAEENGKLVGSSDDPSIRPNQVIAIALKYPVLVKERWEPVLEVVKRELLTPVGLRSLSRHNPNYHAQYDGDLRARDAAYHQGTVWAWLIGPFCNAWLRTYPSDTASVRTFLDGFESHLDDDGVGTISEIFDAEPPFTPRGCMAQAWSVAEVLRCLLMISNC
ncbi:MAG TPA: amylo-alpha-1,6-glucosidase [Edaphobacter sp.]|nr:amylo-alpha-1,6-glucosidase [Edaphobacter sp.]